MAGAALGNTDPEDSMRRSTTTLVAAGAVLAGLVAAVAPAAGATDLSPRTASSQRPLGGGAWDMHWPFAREVVRFKDRDVDPRHIEHVTELQYRLRWVGAYRGPITGHFDVKLRDAVRRYQKRMGLEVTGVAYHRVWHKLIPQTVKARRLIPHQCRNGGGWHICYDRYRHQVTLWVNGRLRNSWLVRGGDRGYETRTGDFHVYLRDKDHVSGIYGTPMPYSQFFSGGQAFHGSAFMTDPWQDHSHGCVNMYIEDARQLWKLTSKNRLKVRVYGAWD